ncbi:MAG: hypothetical protein EON60_07395 [Alphaproteobacteria bacterium]|nr:MAG: hypothetical protein EON60_07395 [Alphaproteobacteria bacterium]
MTLLNGILLGILLALALKRKNAVDPLGHWRWIAAVAGALFPHVEVVFTLLGPGTITQGLQGVTWSLLLMPVYAVALAGFMAMCARVDWEDMFRPIVAGLSAAWLLAVLTEPGIFPLALLMNWRVGLAVLDGFDVIVAGLCIVSLGMAYGFKLFDRDIARLAVACVLGYIGVAALWSYQAREFAYDYARVQSISNPVVHVLPQALSPLNWRIVVAEANGRVHDTMITLGRGSPHEKGAVASPYAPRDAAVWKIHRRYGGMEQPEETQRRARLAWYGWQDTPFGWLGRYTVFERLYAQQEVGIGVGCVGFKDIRVRSEEDAVEGTYVVCPVGDVVRVFRPSGPKDKKGYWPRMVELVSFGEVRR